MKKIYLVNLEETERTTLHDLIKTGTGRARKIMRAHVLLHAHEGATDKEIAQALHISPSTVERTRRRFVTGNLERALNEDPRPGKRPKLDGKQAAFLIATACSTPPEGSAHWTMQMLADRMMELQRVESLSDETVRRILKKTTSNPGRKRNGVFPPWAPSSSGAWKTSWTCMPNPRTRTGPGSASMNVLIN